MTEFDTSQVFRVKSPVRLLTPLILVSVITVGIVFLVSEPDARWIALILGGVLAFSVALAVWLLTRTRLDVSPQGITYYAIGYRVHSSWSNVAGWGKRVQGAKTLDSLILREPGIEMSGWVQIGYELLPLINIASLLSGQAPHISQVNLYAGTIPVEIFDKDWRNGELGALLRCYAPQALDNQV